MAAICLGPSMNYFASVGQFRACDTAFVEGHTRSADFPRKTLLLNHKAERSQCQIRRFASLAAPVDAAASGALKKGIGLTERLRSEEPPVGGKRAGVDGFQHQMRGSLTIGCQAGNARRLRLSMAAPKNEYGGFRPLGHSLSR